MSFSASLAFIERRTECQHYDLSYAHLKAVSAATSITSCSINIQNDSTFSATGLTYVVLDYRSSNEGVVCEGVRSLSFPPDCFHALYNSSRDLLLVFDLVFFTNLSIWFHVVD